MGSGCRPGSARSAAHGAASTRGGSQSPRPARLGGTQGRVETPSWRVPETASQRLPCCQAARRATGERPGGGSGDRAGSLGQRARMGRRLGGWGERQAPLGPGLGGRREPGWHKPESKGGRPRLARVGAPADAIRSPASSGTMSQRERWALHGTLGSLSPRNQCGFAMGPFGPSWQPNTPTQPGREQTVPRNQAERAGE